MIKRNKFVRELKIVLKNTIKIVFTFSKMLYYFHDQIAIEKFIDNRFFNDHDKNVIKLFNICKIFEKKISIEHCFSRAR